MNALGIPGAVWTVILIAITEYLNTYFPEWPYGPAIVGAILVIVKIIQVLSTPDQQIVTMPSGAQGAPIAPPDITTPGKVQRILLG